MTTPPASPAPCRRTSAHTPHDGCPGTAPEYPSERIEQVADRTPSLADLARQLVESYDQDGAVALARPDWARLAAAVLREVARG